ncbi:MAG TPA: hypothetical protein DCS07_04050 [Bdellovibrionales bacterium]|nr:MAG: hypothetical protein A2X97_16500 [Bdellovibrionales bacterium GWA1_52_35]HAR41790.1 hypothetical protein [Bdellovibrionales bacterium]HCM39013.1 hypothetical protein [Bdellovibrionales bacterium]
MNEVRFYGFKGSRALARQLERRIEKWIAREQGWRYRGSEWQYLLEIEELDSSYQCSILIQTGSQELQSQDTGKTIQDAMTLALKHLRSTTAGKRSSREFSFPLFQEVPAFDS